MTALNAESVVKGRVEEIVSQAGKLLQKRDTGVKFAIGFLGFKEDKSYWGATLYRLVYDDTKVDDVGQEKIFSSEEFETLDAVLDHVESELRRRIDEKRDSLLRELAKLDDGGAK